jgi:uncharacterized Fe-S cluster protein YjdI/CDGSH-type Zn-finger protein
MRSEEIIARPGARRETRPLACTAAPSGIRRTVYVGYVRKVYRGQDIEVSFDLDICIHVGECLRGDPKVFRLERRPWVLPDEADPDVVQTVIERCPSGALQYRRLDGKPQESHPRTTTVTPMRDGPLLVVGNIDVTRDDGSVETLPRASLCRCGQSKVKPFCDNSHLTSGFRAPGVKFRIHLSPVRLELDRPMAKADDPRGAS